MDKAEPKQQEQQRQQAASQPAPSYNDYVSIDVGSEPVGLAFNLQSTADVIADVKQERSNSPR